MEIRPVETEADHEAALKEIERLFDATPGTPEGDRLEVLTTLVEAYEEKRYAIPLPDPVEATQYAGLGIPAEVLIQPYKYGQVA